jgi:hypothetical protein
MGEGKVPPLCGCLPQVLGGGDPGVGVLGEGPRQQAIAQACALNVTREELAVVYALVTCFNLTGEKVNRLVEVMGWPT